MFIVRLNGIIIWLSDFSLSPESSNDKLLAFIAENILVYRVLKSSSDIVDFESFVSIWYIPE